MARQREADAKGLAEQGFAPLHTAQDKAREQLKMERDLTTQRARLAETLAALREAGHGRAAFLAETRHALHDRARR